MKIYFVLCILISLFLSTFVAANEKLDQLKTFTQDQGDWLTTNQGLLVSDDNNQLKAGPRGPSLLEDFHFREKMTHFDHERIPERIVHARGVGAHGYFQPYEDFSEYTKAALFKDPSKKTPVFVRFSTVAGSRGSTDIPRDVRGFAIKFYTEEGIWDMVGNNIPIFFIQDAVKFPDLIHSVKPEPHNEVPQAQSAHDTFWDFASLTPETTHMLMWVMSDRGIPRSLSTMEGFGIHTFRLINASGKSRFVKFHLKPIEKGVHSFVWNEALKVSGQDPDFHRRDIEALIESGNPLEWNVGFQIIEEDQVSKFDFDILDATKLIPEEDFPIKFVGKLVLDKMPDNYFAETEQVAFHPGHVVPGIDFTNDPLLQGRLHSYIDTQISRVGINFAEIPINQPINKARNNQRDGRGRMHINKGKVSYFPNSLGNNKPSPSAQGYVSHHERIEGWKVRERSASFADHFSQATMFWNSMADWEKKHIIDAFSFELNMVQDQGVRSAVVNNLLINVNETLAQGVSLKTGIEITAKRSSVAYKKASPSLSMDKKSQSIKGRKVAVLVADGFDFAEYGNVSKTITDQKASVVVISNKAGFVVAAGGQKVKIDKPLENAPSVLFDAWVVIGGEASSKTLGSSGLANHGLKETFMHGKPVAALGTSSKLLYQNNIPVDINQGVFSKYLEFGALFVEALKRHKYFNRSIESIDA
ncbi:catalase [Acrasis kona]|uniref:Catalase n=1 Tax=Acrasis kona TaxID=1008807 RepID=A0AAW2YKB9_9EUKA